MQEIQFDLVIIGAGPAGTSAAVYAGRKKIKTLLITGDFGGQSVVSENIQNWIGDTTVSGGELAKRFETHVNAYAGEDLEVLKNTQVKNIVKKVEGVEECFEIEISGKYQDKNIISTKTVLIATGSIRRKLEAINADTFEHKGLTYCASCDGLFFAGRDVVVVGAGNAAFESALQLAAYCSSVKIFVRSDSVRADEVTQDAVAKNSKIQIIKNVEIVEVFGEKSVSGIKYKNANSEDILEMTIAGIFVEIGQIPNTAFAKEACKIDSFGRVEIDPWTQKTSEAGLWAAGDCTNIKYHQNNIAAGDGVKALEDIYQYLQGVG